MLRQSYVKQTLFGAVYYNGSPLVNNATANSYSRFIIDLLKINYTLRYLLWVQTFQGLDMKNIYGNMG